MNKHIENVTKSLKSIITEMSEQPSLFVRNPQTYFSVSTNKEISLIILVVLTHGIPLTWIFQGKSSSFIM